MIKSIIAALVMLLLLTFGSFLLQIEASEDIPQKIKPNLVVGEHVLLCGKYGDKEVCE